MPINYEQLPEELKWDRQWALAGPDDQTGKYRAPYSYGQRGIFKISPVDKTHWKDFESIVDATQVHKPCGLGYILSKNDPYACIDLDIKNANNETDPAKWTSQENIDRFHRIIEAFGSYTERSASGQGFHIWVRGAIGEGARRDGVEVYSQERFIVCTGDVYLNKEIENRQELLNLLVQEIRQASPDTNKIELVEVEQTESDEVIFERARTADNADKFITLCEGDWTGYPSQSEADLALMSIFAFYTKSNEQCRRLFRATKLADRTQNEKNRHKHDRNNYHLDRILSIIRGRQQIEEQLDAYGAASSAALLASMQGNAHVAATAAPHSAPAHAGGNPTLPQQANPVQTAILKSNPILFPDEIAAMEQGEEDEDREPSSLEWPPGMIGCLARHIFENSPRPVREVSIVAALGLLAGVCGKAFNIPQSGLNLYIVLVARSAIGKEAMHSGIANIMNSIGSASPTVMSFVDFSDYASGPALSKAVAANSSFVNVSGEWGRKLKRLGQEDGKEGPMQQLRTVMTNLYQKSGSGSIVGGIGYSDKDKNIASVSGAAYSMIGESTPKTFYDSLTETMMEDGFLSRFIVIEYTGNRPAANSKFIDKPEPILLSTLTALMEHAVALNGRAAVQAVTTTADANEILVEFDKECDIQVNATDDEGWRQMWNRAHLKTYRISALLAIADNHINPVIRKDHVEWALNLIRKDIQIMSRRIRSGDVGTGDSTRERKLLSILHKYMSAADIAPGYGVPKQMHADGIIPRKYLQITTQRSSAFTSHRAGQNAILDATIKSLIDSGYLLELGKDKALKDYSFHGRAFRIVNLPLNSKEAKEVKVGLNK